MRKLTITTKLTNTEDYSFASYLKEISRYKLMSVEEEFELTKKSSKGDEKAIEELVKRNLRFVISVAKQYVNPQNPVGDLVNQGNIGLIMAARKFNPESGVKFISYAVWWIRKLIITHLGNNGRLIRLPFNKLNALSRVNKEVNNLEQKLGRDVSIGELFQNFNFEDENLTKYGESSFDLEALNVLSGYGLASLDIEMGHDENGSTLGENIVNDTFKPNDYGLYCEDMKNQVDKVLNFLKPRDKQIMVALFGLDGSTPKTLKDVGDEFGITRETVRQIKEKSLVKLKKKLQYADMMD